MATLGAFFDANVLYPSVLRNFLMHLALIGIFRAHWSAEVHEEWIRNLLKNRPDLSRDKLQRTRHLMDKAIPDALVTGYEHLIDSIELPDRNDRHVLAAALRSGSPRPNEQALACGCIAHEAAHVEHEGHLYKTFPDVYGRTLDCGDRSRQTFIKALDVWSEYAACRSSAQFRPEALEDFDRGFCLALEQSRSISQRWIENFRDGGNATETFREVQQAFGDAFICAGYLLGHLHGLERHGTQDAPRTSELLSENIWIAELIARLERQLHELWLSEFGWGSLEVFAPLYDTLCEMMALHGMAFARHGDEWRVIMSDEPAKSPALRDFLVSKANELRSDKERQESS